MQTDFNIHCMHLPTCTLCWIPDSDHHWIEYQFEIHIEETSVCFLKEHGHLAKRICLIFLVAVEYFGESIQAPWL